MHEQQGYNVQMPDGDWAYTRLRGDQVAVVASNGLHNISPEASHNSDLSDLESDPENKLQCISRPTDQLLCSHEKHCLYYGRTWEALFVSKINPLKLRASLLLMI
jgi:hypothetical protein